MAVSISQSGVKLFGGIAHCGKEQTITSAHTENAKESEKMTTKEIDAYICACPYFGGKDTINKRLFVDGTTHIGECALEFHHRYICPSKECRCASKLFGEREDE